jgi:glycosyltransferase involved in cell wall biosynthesis
MSKLAVIRDKWLNIWDASTYYGVIKHGVELMLCGRGNQPDWDALAHYCPEARFVNYSQPWEILELEPDVVDLPDAHYDFTIDMVKRHERTVIVTYDNLPGKNTLRPQAIETLSKAWKHVARSRLAGHTLLFDGVSVNKIGFIPAAVDDSIFKPGPSFDKRRRVVLFVGRVELQKGLLDLIWAMHGLKGAVLWVVGEGGAQSYFEEWAGRLNVPVTWYGFIKNRFRLAQIYQEARVFCLPSVPLLDQNNDLAWLEQFGAVLLEAMASGTPCVATQSGAIPEVLADSGAPVVAPRDWAGLRGAIGLLLDGVDGAWDAASIKHIERARAFSQAEVGKQIKEYYEL